MPVTIRNGPQERTNAVAASISDIRLLLKVKSLPKSSNSRRVFITGGTGYIGSSLIPVLIERDHRVRALAAGAGLPRDVHRAKERAHLSAQFEALTGYLPPEFEKFWQHQLLRVKERAEEKASAGKTALHPRN